MKDPKRIPADPEYLQSLGRAVYNFTYLEWGIVWTIAKLSSDGFASVPRGETARAIAKALTNAIDTTNPKLSASLRIRLVKLDEQFRKAISERNKLFHAHPYTAKDGSQQLGGGGLEWPIENIRSASIRFEELAIECNAIFHGPLKKERS